MTWDFACVFDPAVGDCGWALPWLLAALLAGIACLLHAATPPAVPCLQNAEEVGTGLLTYPVLMAADILLYQVQAWQLLCPAAMATCHNVDWQPAFCTRGSLHAQHQPGVSLLLPCTWCAAAEAGACCAADRCGAGRQRSGKCCRLPCCGCPLL